LDKTHKGNGPLLPQADTMGLLPHLPDWFVHVDQMQPSKAAMSNVALIRLLLPQSCGAGVGGFLIYLGFEHILAEAFLEVTLF